MPKGQTYNKLLTKNYREADFDQRRTPGPSSAVPTNSIPAASSVSRMSFILAGVALSSPFSDSIRLIVLELTLDASDKSDKVQFNAARAIRNWETVTLDTRLSRPNIGHMDNYMHFIDIQIRRLEGAYAPNTIKSYYADVIHFVDWCEQRNSIPFPLTDSLLTEFVTYHGHSHKYATLRRKLAALRKVNALIGYDPPRETQDFLLALRRIRRSQEIDKKQVRGINRDLLLRMIAAQPDTIRGLRNKALLSLGSDFLARRSELTALSPSDIEFQRDGTLRATIRRSKSDPYGRGRLVYGSDRSAKLLRKWLYILPHNHTTLFCPTCHGQIVDRPMSGRSISEIIKRAVIKTRGERPRESEVSGHSLRVGAAQDLLTMGYDVSAIMRAGGWSDLKVMNNYLKLVRHNVWA